MGKYVNGNGKYVYSMDDCSCNVCAHYSAKRGGCQLEECCCLEEKQEAQRHFPPDGYERQKRGAPCRG